MGIGHGFCVNLCLGFELGFGDGLLSLAKCDGLWWWLGALCEVKTNEVLGLWICVWVVGFV